MSHRDGLGRLALVCPAQSADRVLVRLPWRIPSLITERKMKTTNLKQTKLAKPRKWFRRRRRWHDPREARPEGRQFRDQPPSREAMASHRRSRLHLREFAKNSRVLPRLRAAQIEPQNLYSLVNRVLRTPLAFGKLMEQLTK